MVAQVLRSAAQKETNNPIRLTGSRDKQTGKGIFPAIPAASPAAPRYEPLLLSEEATLYSYTIIHPNPKSGLPPFALAYADFPEGVRVFGRLHLREGTRPQIGMRLRTAASARQDEDQSPDSYFFVLAEGE
jgi:uncharacterized OB-fold protein